MKRFKTRIEEKMVIEVPKEAKENDSVFAAMWMALIDEKGDEITNWLNDGKTLTFENEGAPS